MVDILMKIRSNIRYDSNIVYETGAPGQRLYSYFCDKVSHILDITVHGIHRELER